jgi:hypothetical protein
LSGEAMLRELAKVGKALGSKLSTFNKQLSTSSLGSNGTWNTEWSEQVGMIT